MNGSLRKAQGFRNRLTDPILPKFRIRGDKRKEIRIVKLNELDLKTIRSRSTSKKEKFFFWLKILT